MVIEKSYGETIEVGGNRWVRLGVTLKSNKQLFSSDEIKIQSKKMLALGKKLIQEDIKTIRGGSK